MNQYQQFRQWVEGAKCKRCGGIGEVDDSDPHDLFFNRYTCNVCKGTGIEPIFNIWVEFIRCEQYVNYNYLKNLKEDELRHYLDTQFGQNKLIRFLLDNNCIRGVI